VAFDYLGSRWRGRISPDPLVLFAGSSGYLLVADGTRRATLDAAVKMQQRVRDTIGDVPFVFMLNKSDLADGEIAERTIDALSKRGWTWLKASAKTGAGVEEAFLTLVGKMMEG
jgi:GTPase SAR1 family protein